MTSAECPEAPTAGKLIRTVPLSQEWKTSQVVTMAKVVLEGSSAKNLLDLSLVSRVTCLFWSLSCFPDLHLLPRQNLAELHCKAAQIMS